SIRRWTPLPWVEMTGDRDASRHLFLPLQAGTGGPSVLVGFHLFGTSGGPDLPEPLILRLFCHALLGRLPNEALSEAVESLVGMYDHYRLPYTPPQPLLPPRSVKARVTGSYVRPVFPVTEE